MKKRGRKPSKEVTKTALKNEAKPENYFILCTGHSIKDIKELAEELGRMEDSVFRFHVNEQRNDFATWIYDVFKNTELAEILGKIKDKTEMQIIIYKYIVKKLW